MRCRAPHILPPRSLWPLKGPALLLLLRRAARARGSACKKKAGGVAPKTPFIARAISAAAFPQQTPSPSPHRYSVRQPCSPKSPARRSRACGRAGHLPALWSPLRGIAPYSCGCAIPTMSSEAPIRALRRSQSPRPFNGTQQRSAPFQVCPHLGHCKSGLFLPNQPKAFDFFGSG